MLHIPEVEQTVEVRRKKSTLLIQRVFLEENMSAENSKGVWD